MSEPKNSLLADLLKRRAKGSPLKWKITTPGGDSYSKREKKAPEIINMWVNIKDCRLF